MSASKITKIGIATLTAASLLATFATPAFAQQANQNQSATTITILKTTNK